MARYGDYYGSYDDWGYPPYVSVAERRARAVRELSRVARARGRPPEPVVLARRGRRIATTFWGRAWCDNLERYMDYANRLPRGRSYVRNGLVVDLAITPGTVEALVCGSDLYSVRIGITPMKGPRWRAMVNRCTGKIGSLVALLRGELSGDVLGVLADPTSGLFPEPREIGMTCSCPDWAAMCKHVAATLYGVGTRLDTKPELFFTLRQVDQAELLSSATAGAVSRGRPASGKQIVAAKLADVFGIELEDAPPTAGPMSPGRARPRPTGRVDRVGRVERSGGATGVEASRTQRPIRAASVREPRRRTRKSRHPSP